MKFVLLYAPLIVAEAGLWSGGSEILSFRIPDIYDLDMRKIAKKDLQQTETYLAVHESMAEIKHQAILHASSGRGTSKASANMVKAKVSVSENRSTELTNRSATHGPKKQKQPRRKRNAEASLIDSLRHVGEKGEDAVICVTTCRYGEATRHEWRECLDRCVENPLMRSTFLSMLPEEHHKAHSTEAEVPEILQKRLEHKRQRSAEL